MIRYFLILLFLLISCSDTINNTTTTVSTVESDTKGDLYVYAKDIISGELISHAEYSSPVVQDTSLIIHGNKGICFQDLPVGENYAVYVSAEKYAPVVCNASIKFAENVNSPNMSFVENTTLEVILNKLSATLKGSLFYQNPKNPMQLDVLPAQGAKISLIVKDSGNCSYLKKTFGPISVDSAGYFVFDSLPEKASYLLIVHDHYIKGFLFSGMEQDGVLDVSRNTTVLSRMIYKTMQSAFGFEFTYDNRSFTQREDTLKFSFSEPVNKSLLQNQHVSIVKVDSSKNIPIAANFIWTDSNKTLKIIPAFGEWEANGVYEIYMKLYSSYSSEVIDTTLNFYVQEFFDLSKDKVSGLLTSNVNYNSASITLKWNSLSGAEAYEVFAKVYSNFETIYSLVGETTSITNGKLDTSYVLQTPNWFNKGDSISVIVVARNGKGKSKYSDSLVIKDNIKPEYTKAAQVTALDTANFIINATQYFNNINTESSETLEMVFNEPMDTTQALSVSYPKDSPRKIDVTTVWKSELSLTINIKIESGELNLSESPLSIPITITGLKDYSGNKIKDSNYLKKTWEDLLIILHVDGVTIE